MNNVGLKRWVIALAAANILMLSGQSVAAEEDGKIGKCTTCIADGKEFACCEAACSKDCDCNTTKECGGGEE